MTILGCCLSGDGTWAKNGLVFLKGYKNKQKIYVTETICKWQSLKYLLSLKKFAQPLVFIPQTPNITDFTREVSGLLCSCTHPLPHSYNALNRLLVYLLIWFTLSSPTQLFLSPWVISLSIMSYVSQYTPNISKQLLLQIFHYCYTPIAITWSLQ